MINWKLTLHKLFFMHEWDIRDEGKSESFQYNTTLPYAAWMNYVFVCKTCGTLKRKKIKL